MTEAEEYGKHNSALVETIRTYHGLMSDARMSGNHERAADLRRQLDNLIDAKEYFYARQVLFIKRDSHLQRILSGREAVKSALQEARA